MSGPIVEQLLNGVKVQCADGTVVPCRPLPLGVAMEIIDRWNERNDDTATVEVRAAARLAVCQRFLKLYPQLAEHVSAGDVDVLVPGFFWGLTGATVLRPAPEPPAPESTGTPSGATTLPIGESSPT